MLCLLLWMCAKCMPSAHGDQRGYQIDLLLLQGTEERDISVFQEPLAWGRGCFVSLVGTGFLRAYIYWLPIPQKADRIPQFLSLKTDKSKGKCDSHGECCLDRSGRQLISPFSEHVWVRKQDSRVLGVGLAFFKVCPQKRLFSAWLMTSSAKRPGQTAGMRGEDAPSRPQAACVWTTASIQKDPIVFFPSHSWLNTPGCRPLFEMIRVSI